MKSDDKAMPAGRADADRSDKPEAKAELPPLRDARDRQPNIDEQRAREHQMMDEQERMQREQAQRGADPGDEDMTRPERARMEREKAAEESRRQHAEENERIKERERQAAMKPAEGNMRMFTVYAENPEEPPFHFSSTPGVMLVAAPDEDYARRLAVQSVPFEHADAWADEERVGVTEYKPSSPMVLSTDFKG